MKGTRQTGIAILLVFCSTTAHADDRKTWIRELDSLNREKEDAAEKALAAEGPAAFGDVAKVLKKNYQPMRRRAMRLLIGYAQQMKDVDRYRSMLIRLLADTDAEIADGATTILMRCGPKAIPKLFGLLESTEPGVAARARRALVGSGKRCVPYIQNKIGVKYPRTVLRALELLPELRAHATSTIPAIRPLLVSRSSRIRIAAHLAIAVLEPKEEDSVSILVKLLDSPLKIDAHAAVGPLCGYPAQAAAVLAPRLNGAPSITTDRAAFVLFNIGPAAEPSLIKILGAQSGRGRAHALRRLTVLRKSIDAMARAKVLLVSGNTEERIAAARFLSVCSVDGEWLQKQLPILLKDKVPEVGDWAWYRLWWMRNGPPPKRDITDLEVLGRIGKARKLIELAKPATATPRVIRALAIFSQNYAPGTPRDRARRVATLDKGIRQSCDRAWKRLQAQQNQLGFWADGMRPDSVGVTALVLMSFSAGGHTDADGPYAKTIRAAIRALTKGQTKDGWLSTPGTRTAIIEHSLATAALADAYLTGSSPLLIEPIRRAAHRLLALRRKRGVWGYDPTAESADMYHTAWACYAARLCTLAGVLSIESYREPIQRYVEKMTDREFGQIGYSIPGGSVSRPKGMFDKFPVEKSQSMTAAGVWVRIMLDGGQRKNAQVVMGRRLVRQLLPQWDEEDGSIDMTGWHFGALAFAILKAPSQPGKDRKVFRNALRTALLENQRPTGEWKPLGAWGEAGGVHYSTAMPVLALLAPALMSPDFAPGTKKSRPGLHGEARAALEDAVKSKDPRVAWAAYIELQ